MSESEGRSQPHMRSLGGMMRARAECSQHHPASHMHACVQVYSVGRCEAVGGDRTAELCGLHRIEWAWAELSGGISRGVSVWGGSIVATVNQPLTETPLLMPPDPLAHSLSLWLLSGQPALHKLLLHSTASEEEQGLYSGRLCSEESCRAMTCCVVLCWAGTTTVAAGRTSSATSWV